MPAAADVLHVRGASVSRSTGRNLKRKAIGARSLRVLHFKQAQDVRGCQVLFIGAEEKKFLPAILAASKEILS